MAPKKPYECIDCKQIFTNKSKLKEHMKIHAQEIKLKADASTQIKKAGRKKTIKPSAAVKREKKEQVLKPTNDDEACSSNTLAPINVDSQAISSATVTIDEAAVNATAMADSSLIIPVNNNTAILVEEITVVAEDGTSSPVYINLQNSEQSLPVKLTENDATLPSDVNSSKENDNLLEPLGNNPATGATQINSSPILGNNSTTSSSTIFTKPLDVITAVPSTSILPPKTDNSVSFAKETIGSLLRKGTLFAHMRGEIANRVQTFLEETNTMASKRAKAKAAAFNATSLAQDKGECSHDKKAGGDGISALESKEDGSFGCIECGVQFTDRALLLQHLACHTDLKIYNCEVCNKKFTRKYHMDRHKTMTSCSGQPPPAHPCQVCGKVYTRKDNLREHLRAHAGEVNRKKRYKCEYCGKDFHGSSLLKIHVRTHTGEKPFQCGFCPKSFPSGGALTKHRRVHTGEKPYECGECGVRFSLKGTLNRHLRIHTGIRPHVCKFCGKQFIQAGGLKAHLFFHTGQNGFKCELCGKIFNRKARLQMHTRYVHEKIKPFDCTDCGKRFTRKEDLYRHYVLHTGEKPFECPTCLKRFSIKPSLKLHLLTHTKEEPRSCHECGRAFIRKDCLLRHMRKRHRDLLDKIFLDEKDEKLGNTSTVGIPATRVMNEQTLCDSIQELLSLLVDEPTLTSFGWPEKPVDELLEAVIRRCGHTPVNPEDYSYMDRLRENAKLLFTVVIDDNAVKTLLNNQTVDEVILHVLRLAKS